MSRKPCMTIERDNGTISIYGNHHWIEMDWDIPEWEKESAKRDEREPDMEQCFRYKGVKYFLSEFMAVHNHVHNPNPPEWLKKFDGYMNDSFFSGVLIKLGTDENEDCVRAYTFIS